jgi:hypothetical protein
MTNFVRVLGNWFPLENGPDFIDRSKADYWSVRNLFIQDSDW